MTVVTIDEVKEAIRKFHKIWYEDDPFKDASSALALHRQCEIMFNFAAIDGTLVENNPNAVSPDEFKCMTGAKDPQERVEKLKSAIRQSLDWGDFDFIRKALLED